MRGFGGGSPRKNTDVPPDGASLDESITFLALKVLPPDVFALLPPAAHQVRADKNIGAAAIASHIMASADVEQPDLMTVAALDVAKTLAYVKIAQESVR